MIDAMQLNAPLFDPPLYHRNGNPTTMTIITITSHVIFDIQIEKFKYDFVSRATIFRERIHHRVKVG